jgi:hypothetical protein
MSGCRSSAVQLDRKLRTVEVFRVDRRHLPKMVQRSRPPTATDMLGYRSIHRFVPDGRLSRPISARSPVELKWASAATVEPQKPATADRRAIPTAASSSTTSTVCGRCSFTPETVSSDGNLRTAPHLRCDDAAERYGDKELRSIFRSSPI